MDQNLTQNVDTLFTNMENFTQKEGLIGKPVVHGDKTLIPVISVTLGYGSGNTENKSQGTTTPSNATTGAGNLSGGALGLGARLSTDAVIVIDKQNVSLVPINSTAASTPQIIDKIPQIISGMTNQQQQSK